MGRRPISAIVPPAPSENTYRPSLSTPRSTICAEDVNRAIHTYKKRGWGPLSRKVPIRHTRRKTVHARHSVCTFILNPFIHLRTVSVTPGVPLLANLRSFSLAPFQQPAKQFRHFLRPHVPRAVPHRVLPSFAVARKVRTERFLNHRQELFARPVDSDSRRVQVLIQRRNHHRLTSRQ